ncbi:MAG: aromatic ring-hydroxylating dioxygenase subunit alpha [Parvibaculaceae bacterium]
MRAPANTAPMIEPAAEQALESPGLVLGEEERGGLPWWAYFNPELLEIEKETLFRGCWQFACHVNDVPEPGQYRTFDIVGERALIVRGKDRVVRAFHNVCRHRGSRVVADEQGRCKGAIVCPFHGWSYNLDGTLRAVRQPRSLPKLDSEAHGLVPLEFEIWHGLVFVRFVKSDQPSVATLMAPFEEEVAPYRIEEMRPLDPIGQEELAVNWKAVRDVDNEGYHVAMAHPSLEDLYGRRYVDDRHRRGVARSFAPFNESESRRWSTRLYRKILPEVEHLPASHRRAWLYIGLFPNAVFSLYPDTFNFYQEYPVGIDRTMQRYGLYGLNDDRREMKLARYLSRRIDKATSAEDHQLIGWSWEAMQSSGFAGYILSDLEVGVRDYHDNLRRMMPVMALEEEPRTGRVVEINTSLLSAQGGSFWQSGES